MVTLAGLKGWGLGQNRHKMMEIASTMDFTNYIVHNQATGTQC